MIASNGADQSSGIGFAIPINTAKAVLDDFAKYGRIRRPTLDIVTLPIGPDIAEQIGLPADYGLLIERVLPGGAAEKAGLHGGTQRAYEGNTPVMLGGDLIVGFDGQEITSAQDLAAAMNCKAGRRYGDGHCVPRTQAHGREGDPGRCEGFGAGIANLSTVAGSWLLVVSGRTAGGWCAAKGALRGSRRGDCDALCGGGTVCEGTPAGHGGVARDGGTAGAADCAGSAGWGNDSGFQLSDRDSDWAAVGAGSGVRAGG